MSLEEFKNLLAIICWEQKNQPLTIRSKDKYTGRYRLGTNSLFVPETIPL